MFRWQKALIFVIAIFIIPSTVGIIYIVVGNRIMGDKQELERLEKKIANLENQVNDCQKSDTDDEQVDVNKSDVEENDKVECSIISGCYIQGEHGHPEVDESYVTESWKTVEELNNHIDVLSETNFINIIEEFNAWDKLLNYTWSKLEGKLEPGTMSYANSDRDSWFISKKDKDLSTQLQMTKDRVSYLLDTYINI